MMTTVDLYDFADKRGYYVYWYTFDDQRVESMACMDSDGDCHIALDPFRFQSESDERYKMAHELGHCETGSFYNRYAACDIRQKHENRADKWAIQALIPRADLEEAILEGYTEVWSLADCFHVPEDFVRKAICWYKNGNLSEVCY